MTPSSHPQALAAVLRLEDSLVLTLRHNTGLHHHAAQWTLPETFVSSEEGSEAALKAALQLQFRLPANLIKLHAIGACQEGIKFYFGELGFIPIHHLKHDIHPLLAQCAPQGLNLLAELYGVGYGPGQVSPVLRRYTHVINGLINRSLTPREDLIM